MPGHRASPPGQPEAVLPPGACLGKQAGPCCRRPRRRLTLDTVCKFTLALKQGLSAVAETLCFQSSTGSVLCNSGRALPLCSVNQNAMFAGVRGTDVVAVWRSLALNEVGAFAHLWLGAGRLQQDQGVSPHVIRRRSCPLAPASQGGCSWSPGQRGTSSCSTCRGRVGALLSLQSALHVHLPLLVPAWKLAALVWISNKLLQLLVS